MAEKLTPFSVCVHQLSVALLQSRQVEQVWIMESPEYEIDESCISYYISDSGFFKFHSGGKEVWYLFFRRQ